LDSMHEFDWEGGKDFGWRENFIKECLISEMIHIKQQKNGLNLKIDTDLLNSAYSDIILTT